MDSRLRLRRRFTIKREISRGSQIFKNRRDKTKIIDTMFRNLSLQCRFISASFYTFILCVLKVKHSIKQSLSSLYAAVFYLSLGLITEIILYFASCINVLKFPKIIIRKSNFISQPHIMISEKLFVLGHYEQAKIILSKVSQFNNVRILNNLAISQSRQGKYNEAISTIGKALHICKNDEKLLYNRESFVYARNGNKLGRLVSIDKYGQLHVVKNNAFNQKRQNAI